MKFTPKRLLAASLLCLVIQARFFGIIHKVFNRIPKIPANVKIIQKVGDATQIAQRATKRASDFVGKHPVIGTVGKTALYGGSSLGLAAVGTKLAVDAQDLQKDVLLDSQGEVIQNQTFFLGHLKAERDMAADQLLAAAKKLEKLQQHIAVLGARSIWDVPAFQQDTDGADKFPVMVWAIIIIGAVLVIIGIILIACAATGKRRRTTPPPMNPRMFYTSSMSDSLSPSHSPFLQFGQQTPI